MGLFHGDLGETMPVYVTRKTAGGETGALSGGRDK